jgi:hypothetical protein
MVNETRFLQAIDKIESLNNDNSSAKTQDKDKRNFEVEQCQQRTKWERRILENGK